MESEGDEDTHQPPKWSRPTKQAQFSSTSVKDSFLTIPVLPEELITEILLRLPVEPLLKFRSVSKSWLALISSPEFVKTHLSVSANNKDYTHHRVMHSFRCTLDLKDYTLSSLFSESVTEVFDLNYRMTSDGLYNEWPHSVMILGSVNGLICLVGERYDLFLWNPSNRKYKKLPDPTSTMWFEQWRIYGFGYDEFHDDYKLVGGFCSDDKSGLGGLKIYSLKSDSWGSVDDRQSQDEIDVSGKFVKGKLHWPTATVDHLIINYKDWNIISFDLANEKWGEVEHPCYREGDIALILGVLGSDLSVFCDYSSSHVDVWVMKEYGVKESWTKMFTINYPDHLVGYGHALSRPSFISNKGEILVVFISASVIYNPKDASLRYSKAINFYDYPKEVKQLCEEQLNNYSTPANCMEHNEETQDFQRTFVLRHKTATSYRELEARKSRVRDLEKVYMDMAMQKELQKSGRKCKLREEELVNPTTKPVYKWRQERKR